MCACLPQGSGYAPACGGRGKLQADMFPSLALSSLALSSSAIGHSCGACWVVVDHTISLGFGKPGG